MKAQGRRPTFIEINIVSETGTPDEHTIDTCAFDIQERRGSATSSVFLDDLENTMLRLLKSGRGSRTACEAAVIFSNAYSGSQDQEKNCSKQLCFSEQQHAIKHVDVVLEQTGREEGTDVSPTNTFFGEGKAGGLTSRPLIAILEEQVACRMLIRERRTKAGEVYIHLQKNCWLTRAPKDGDENVMEINTRNKMHQIADLYQLNLSRLTYEIANPMRCRDACFLSNRQKRRICKILIHKSHPPPHWFTRCLIAHQLG
jgi:hypothetical protein